MTYLLLQTFLLLLASYFLGAFIACLVRRTFFAAGASAAMREPIPAVVVPASAVARSAPARAARRVQVEPRPFDPVQPRIEVFKRPEPRPAPKLVDPSRFERALLGPDPNEGMPRKAIVELRPAVLKSPTSDSQRTPPVPVPPRPVAKPAPPAQPAAPTPAPSLAKIVAQEVAREQREARAGGSSEQPTRPNDATTASAAAAVAASKAAAAASVSHLAPVKAEPKPQPQAQPAPQPPPAQSTPPAAPAKAATAATPPSAEQPYAFKLPDPPITEGDDLQRIRAIDFLTEQKLKSIGVLYFDHIAGWSVPDVRRIGQTLDIPGRIDREQWIEQAQILAKGGETYYSRNRAASVKPKGAEAGASPPASAGPAEGNPAISPLRSKAAAEPAASQASADRSDAVSSTGKPASSGEPTLGDRKPTQGEAPPSARQGFESHTSGKSVAELAQAAAAAIAAASASVTRGLRPIEPISPLSKVDPKISIPAKLSDAIKERSTSASASAHEREGGTSPPVAPAGKPAGKADDLKRIRGIGVLIEKRLNAAGVTRYEHIASWTNADIDRYSRMLEFKGRIERENWIEQARILANGGQTEFSARVDRGEIDTSKET